MNSVDANTFLLQFRMMVMAQFDVSGFFEHLVCQFFFIVFHVNTCNLASVQRNENV